MPFGVPVTPADVVKNAATTIVADSITRALIAADAGDNVTAAQEFFRATAVAAAFAAGTLWGFTAYPVSGLSQALRNLATSPGKYETVLAKLLPKLGLATDPVVISRLATVSKPFAGGAAAGYLVNELIDFLNSLSIGAALYDWTHIDPSTNTNFTSARNWVPRRDPLVLDLNGGGITTSGINPAAPLYFDHAGDGLPNATGWVGAGEGLVVRDLNGNGLIDSGRELFGDNTVLTSGPNAGKNATDGFAALRDLDSNADGKFDASDAAFSSVKIWTDANGDAISQTAELHSFADLGLQSISLSATPSNINLGNGNTQTFAGSFTQLCGRARRASVPTGLRARGRGAWGTRLNLHQQLGLHSNSAATANWRRPTGTATRHAGGGGRHTGEHGQVSMNRPGN